MSTGPRIRFVNFSTTESVVARAFSKMKSKKSRHIRSSIFLLEKCVDVLLPVVVYLFKLSIGSGVFPKSLKTAIVTPISKSGVRKDRKNCRPISCLPFFSKFSERIMHEKMFKLLSRFNIVFAHQNGFVTKRSTTDAILDFCDQSYNYFESKQFLITIFLDLSKVFDTIYHDILCRKSEHYRCAGIIN